MKKLLLTGFFVAILSVYVMANPARIISMGKTDVFFMDEVSIFRFPGNLRYYSNMLIGELGTYMDSTKSTSFYLQNSDPVNPWYGGIIGFGGKGENKEGMFSLGVIVNKWDTFDTLHDYSLDSINLKPLMPLDIFLGYTLKKYTLGLRLHWSGNRYEKEDFAGNLTSKIEANYLLAILGISGSVNDKIDYEIGVGGTMTRIDLDTKTGRDEISVYKGEIVDARIFTDLNDASDLVLAGGYQNIEYNVYEYSKKMYGGIGSNILIDRGFLWLGVQGIKEELKQLDDSTSLYAYTKNIYASLSFGIERNVWWDWFVMRVGGNKTIGKHSERIGSYTVSEFFTNPNSNKFPEDAVGFGVGLNVEDKLKFDGVIAEDVPYTFGKIFSGSLHHIQSRISSTLFF